MEKISQKNILERELRLSTAYTIAFGRPTSKNQIQKYLTNSGRYSTIVDQYKEYFTFQKRPDKRMGSLIKSKPELLLELIDIKIKLEPKQRINLYKLLTNELFEKEIHNVIASKMKFKNRPIYHNILLQEIAILVLGKYITYEYNEFFKPTTNPTNYLKRYNQLDKDFLPELHNKKQTKRDKHSEQMREILNKFSNETIKKLITLHPNHILLKRVVKAGIIISESHKKD